ncbi:MAG: hypothetical protein ACI841_000620 [Planctomycetota bacterium]|jgi:hypothetical protein
MNRFRLLVAATLALGCLGLWLNKSEDRAFVANESFKTASFDQVIFDSSEFDSLTPWFIKSEEEPQERVSLTPPNELASLTPEPIPEVVPDVGLTLLRWPDGKPIVETRVSLFGDPAPAWTKTETSVSGHISLPDDLATGPTTITLQIEEFEQKTFEFEEGRNGTRRQSVWLVPTRGFYGRVVTFDNKPIKGRRVEGFWIEALRPIEGVDLQSRAMRNSEGTRSNMREPFHLSSVPMVGDLPRVPSKPLDDDVEDEDDEPPIGFLSARDAVVATAETTDEGWYYVEPLGGHVLGTMTLFLQDAAATTDVLRISLPNRVAHVPDIVIHRPQPMHAVVVDSQGEPLPDTLVLLRLPGAWSTEIEPIRTDEQGAFVVNAPIGGIEVSVERIGFSLQQGGEWKQESADGMWKAWRDLTGNAERAAACYREAYAAWTSPLPRARHYVHLDPLGLTGEIQLNRLGSCSIRVIDGAGDPVNGARLEMHYGGLEQKVISRTSNTLGLSNFANADRAWQPMLLTVTAENAPSKTLPVPVGPEGNSLTVVVENLEEGSSNSSRASPEGFGSVLDPSGRAVKASIAAYTAKKSTPFWTGSSDRNGEFSFGIAIPPKKKLYYIAAMAGIGESLSGTTAGPFVSTELFNGERINLQLEAGVPIAVEISVLDAQEEYKANFKVAPFRTAAPRPLREITIPKGSFGKHTEVVYVPPLWGVWGQVLSPTRGNTPALDFMRANRSQQGFMSMSYSWKEWEGIGEAGPLWAPHGGSSMWLPLHQRVSLGGSITERPPLDERPLYVSARGSLGDWVSPVTDMGWFAFEDIPRGRYRLTLYALPEDNTSVTTTFSEAVVLGQQNIYCKWSRYDLQLAWE